jgi:hypothetical protein
MAFETLYKTNVPQEMEAAQYYQPHLGNMGTDGTFT